MSFGYFALLPSELLINILVRLPLPALLSVSCLNHSLYKFVKDSVELRYSLALQRYGKVDGGTSEPLNNKLKELLRMEESWRTLRPSNCVTVNLKVQDDASYVYALPNGVCLLPRLEDSREIEYIKFCDLSGCKAGSEVYGDAWIRISIVDRVADGISKQEHDLLGLVCLRET